MLLLLFFIVSGLLLPGLHLGLLLLLSESLELS
jgi:hypothetical protein